MYYNGLGVPQNYAEALKWYRLAAGQGNADAQYNSGVMYTKGQGVPQNYAEALKWCRLADHGFASAQTNLGVMYENGEGCHRTTPRR
jgi:TPR repeat protein